MLRISGETDEGRNVSYRDIYILGIKSRWEDYLERKLQRITRIA